MLTLKVPEREFFDGENSIFINYPAQTLKLEHSLVSISKWESQHHKVFLSKDPLVGEEMLDYIYHMIITQNIKREDVDTFPQKTIDEITDYINDSMTATTFSDRNNRPSLEIITSEIIYYWMVIFNIPMECQKWHLNRLLTLIKVCTAKASKTKPMSKTEIMRRNHALNAERKARLNTTG